MTLEQRSQEQKAALFYESNYDYLVDELRKLDLTIKLRVSEIRHRNVTSRGVLADPQVAISHDEVDRLLGEQFAFETNGSSFANAHRQVKSFQNEIDAKANASIQQGVFLALPQLAHLFALSPLEVQTLLICLAPELDLKYDRLYAYLQDDITRKKPSIDLVLSLVFGTEAERWNARAFFSSDGILFRAGILISSDDPQSPSGSSGLAQFLKLDPRILRYLLGHNHMDERLREFVRPVGPEASMDDVLVDSSIKRGLANLIQSHFSENNVERKRLVLYFYGPYGVGKRELASIISSELGSPLLRLDAEKLMAHPVESDTILRLAFRECPLLQAAIYFENADAFFGEDDRPHPMLKTIAGLTDEYGWLVIWGGEKHRPIQGMFEDAVFQAVELPVPDVPLREEAWKRSLNGLISGDSLAWSRQLANQFRLTPGQIRDAVGYAGNRLAMDRDHEIALADLYEACRAQSNQKLGELGSKVTPHYGWNDIILPEDKVAQLKEVCAQVKHNYKVFGEWGFDDKLSHGKGISVLFSGPPGTGKTMAAQVIAHELRLDLYKVDLSGVVSKYIGETEKNLGRIFDEAETSNAILFFDEADALFGKRTEVSDAHDRYANIETSFLLQKMEEYEGIVILATNLRENMDLAFTRRIRFIVEFPFPDAASRLEIWKTHFPPQAPVSDDIDYDLLSKEFSLAGGNIKNIVLNAAFFAAEDDANIRMDHILRGAKREFEKIGKTWNEQAFLRSKK